MSRTPWYDSDDLGRVQRGLFGSIAIWTIALTILIGGIGIALYGFGVFTSDAKGRGDALKLKNDGTNRVQAQAAFQRDYADIKRFDQQLTDAQATLDAFDKAHPSVGNGTVYDPLAEQQANLSNDVIGIQQQCRRVVAQYNANAQSFTLQDFRDADLPQVITDTDPTTDCKVTSNEKDAK